MHLSAPKILRGFQIAQFKIAIIRSYHNLKTLLQSIVNQHFTVHTWHLTLQHFHLKMAHVLFSVCIALSILTLQCSSADEGQCYTYGGDRQCYASPGGHVYPQETRRTSGHAIQWSQAVSMFLVVCRQIRLFSKPEFVVHHILTSDMSNLFE